MSTTIFLHGVTYEDVIITLPADTEFISATSSGLNYGLIDSFIARAAGMVNAQFVRHGIVPESIDPNTTQIAQDAIISYAAAFCLERLGASPDQIERRKRDWDTMFRMLREEPQSLGSAEDVKNGTIKSNIRTGCERSRWKSGSFRY